MDGNVTVRYLQNYIRQKDHHPERTEVYLMKLAEEVGELSRAMRCGKTAREQGGMKGSIDEEVWDVIYYALAIANLYGIDVEQAAREKSALSEEKYPSGVICEEGR